MIEPIMATGQFQMLFLAASTTHQNDKTAAINSSGCISLRPFHKAVANSELKKIPKTDV
jgi:hypothetical protein